MSAVTTEIPRQQEQEQEQKEQQEQQEQQERQEANDHDSHDAANDEINGDISAFSIKVIEELSLVSQILEEKIKGDEAFVHWLTNEITWYGLLSDGSSVLSIHGDLDDSCIHDLTDIVNQYPSNEFVNRDVLHTLGKYASELDVDPSVVIAVQGGIELVIEAMRKFPNNEQIQQNGCFSIGNMGMSEDVAAIICKRGGVELMIRAMTKFATNEKLQEYGCLALGNMALDDDVCVMVTDQGGIQLVIQALTAFADSEQVIHLYGVFALAVFAHGGDEMRMAVAMQGGIDLVAQTMGKFSEDERVQRIGCLALGNLGVSDEVCPAVVRLGGIGLVVRAMTKFANNEQVQEYACSALGKLSIDDCGDDVVRSFVKESMEAVISTMERFPSNEAIQVGCCFALGQMASTTLQNKATICLDLVVGAMDRFQSSDKLLRLGCYALESWASKSAECKSYLVESLDGVNLARRVWNVLLSQEAKTLLYRRILTIRDRFIFDNEFLSKYRKVPEIF